MKTSNGSFPRRRAPRIDAARRTQLLAVFDRSELSVAAFVWQQGIDSTTFHGRRRRRAQAQTSPAIRGLEPDLSEKGIRIQQMPLLVGSQLSSANNPLLAAPTVSKESAKILK